MDYGEYRARRLDAVTTFDRERACPPPPPSNCLRYTGLREIHGALIFLPSLLALDYVTLRIGAGQLVSDISLLDAILA